MEPAALPKPDLMVAISTHGPRLAGLQAAGLPEMAGLRWRILVQQMPDDTALAAHRVALGSGRADLAVIDLPSSGVAASRNAALDLALAEGAGILVLADDDLTFHAETYPALRAAFAADPDLSFLCGRLADAQGRPHKRYSPAGARVRLWNVAKLGTPELALRPTDFVRAGVRFDTGFGSGTAQPFGEEFILIADALRAGLRGVHSDLLIAEHPPDSSGLRRDAQARAVRRAVFVRALGPVAGRVALGLWQLREALRGNLLRCVMSIL